MKLRLPEDGVATCSVCHKVEDVGWDVGGGIILASGPAEFICVHCAVGLFAQIRAGTLVKSRPGWYAWKEE